MADGQFMRGTLVLLITSIILKIMGFLYQITIIRLIGTEPIGLLNMAYPFYIAFVVLATAGIPLAISKMIAEQQSLNKTSAIRHTMRWAFRIVLLLGGVLTLLSICIIPKLFTTIGNDPRTISCFYILIPGIFIVPLASVIRGYFQGLQQMLYPSLAQICEQIVRLTVGLILVICLKPFGVRYIAMGLAGGMIVGELAGMLLIAFFYYRSLKHLPRHTAPTSNSHIYQNLLSLGIPTTLTRLTSSIDMAIEASLIPFCLLQMGYNQNQSTSLYGQFSGVSLTLITIPTVLTGALSTALVPAISKSSAAHRRQEMSSLCSESLRMTYILSLPIIVVLFCYGETLSQILFHVEHIGPLLRILALGAIFLYLGQTSVGILQGLGLTKAVFVNNLIGSCVKLICIYFFIARGQQGIAGLAWAFILSYTLQCLLNLLYILKFVPIRLSLLQTLLPIGLCTLMLCMLNPLMHFCSLFIGASLGSLIAIIIGGLFYLLLLVATKQLHISLRYFTKKAAS